MLAHQRMLEGNRDRAIRVFDIEDDGVAAHVAPVPDDADPVIATCHDAGQVDGSNFKIFADRDRLLDDRCGQNPRNHDIFAGFQYVVLAVAIGATDGFGKLRVSQIRRPAQVMMRYRLGGVPALGGIDLCSRRGAGLESGQIRRLCCGEARGLDFGVRCRVRWAGGLRLGRQ